MWRTTASCPITNSTHLVIHRGDRQGLRGINTRWDKEWRKRHTLMGTTCIRMAKLVRWLHRHTEYVMFPPERTQPSLDQTPSLELGEEVYRIYRKYHMQTWRNCQFVKWGLIITMTISYRKRHGGFLSGPLMAGIQHDPLWGAH